jgi:hypothetical protein
VVADMNASLRESLMGAGKRTLATAFNDFLMKSLMALIFKMQLRIRVDEAEVEKLLKAAELRFREKFYAVKAKADKVLMLNVRRARKKYESEEESEEAPPPRPEIPISSDEESVESLAPLPKPIESANLSSDESLPALPLRVAQSSSSDEDESWQQKLVRLGEAHRDRRWGYDLPRLDVASKVNAAASLETRGQDARSRLRQGVKGVITANRLALGGQSRRARRLAAASHDRRQALRSDDNTAHQAREVVEYSIGNWLVKMQAAESAARHDAAKDLIADKVSAGATFDNDGQSSEVFETHKESLHNTRLPVPIALDEEDDDGGGGSSSDNIPPDEVKIILVPQLDDDLDDENDD